MREMKKREENKERGRGGKMGEGSESFYVCLFVDLLICLLIYFLFLPSFLHSPFPFLPSLPKTVSR